MQVEYSFAVEPPKNQIEELLMEKFCVRASRDIGLQRGAEYGFSDQRNRRATDLSQLDDEELEGFPANNMVCERNFAKRDQLLNRSAKGASSSFQGLRKFICDYLRFQLYLIRLI
jgi:hypothetical protein